MRCPFCAAEDTRVVNSRRTPTGDQVRRRRECEKCRRRFTTFEYYEPVEFIVVKRDTSREPYEQRKLRAGLQKACEKRPVGEAEVDRMVYAIEGELRNRGRREINSEEIGKLVLRKLREIDEVAYMRFASVYKQFRDLADYSREIESLMKE